MAASKAEINLQLHPKQAIALNTTANEVLFGGSAGGGKLLPLDALIPIPSGWATMGSLAIGSEVFDESGKICRVTQLFDIEQQPELWRLTFDDSTTVECCADHQWLTLDAKELGQLTRLDPEWREARRGRRKSRGGAGNKSDLFRKVLVERNKARVWDYQESPGGTVRTTSEIVDTLYMRGGSRKNHAIRLAAPLDLPNAILPLDPYTLGAWLGDGSRASGCFTGIDPEIWQNIEAAGFEISHQKDGRHHYIRGLVPFLRKIGVYERKHIPPQYLRGSYAQRLALLQGLMDTDGTVAKHSGGSEFCNTNEAIINGVCELIASLGWKVAKAEGRAKLYGRDCGPKWTLKWIPSDYVFRLKRKRDIQTIATRRTTKYRYVTSAERIPSRPGRCIEVDSTSHLYLCGKQMVPTHNSHSMRVSAILWCAAIPGLQVYLFRRIYDDLIKNHVEGPKGFRSMLAPWILCGFVKIVDDEVRFWNGSKIYLCHCQFEKDVYRFQGSEIHVLLIDELTHWTESMYRFLRNRLRMVGLKLPVEHEGKFPRIFCSANPGNIGHQFVKSTFIDGCEAMTIRTMPQADGGMRRQFIPARLEDNPSMETDDPGYEQRLMGLGSETLVRAMRFGDWDVIEGAYFDCWDAGRHTVRPFTIPEHWTRIRGMDWGSAAPFVVQWWAVASETIRVADGRILSQYENSKAARVIPRGCMILYREWYGGSKPNVGLKLTAEVVGHEIAKRERGEKMNDEVLDPAAFAQDGGESIAEKLYKGSDRKVNFRRADNTRVAGRGRMGGWDSMRARMVGDGDGHPMMLVFTTAVDFIRSVPALQHDPHKPEDLQSDGTDDHCGDTARYSLNSRPWTAPTIIDRPIRGAAEMTMKEAWAKAKPKSVSSQRI